MRVEAPLLAREDDLALLAAEERDAVLRVLVAPPARLPVAADFAVERLPVDADFAAERVPVVADFAAERVPAERVEAVPPVLRVPLDVERAADEPRLAAVLLGAEVEVGRADFAVEPEDLEAVEAERDLVPALCAPALLFVAVERVPLCEALRVLFFSDWSFFEVAILLILLRLSPSSAGEGNPYG